MNFELNDIDRQQLKRTDRMIANHRLKLAKDNLRGSLANYLNAYKAVHGDLPSPIEPFIKLNKMTKEEKNDD